MKRGVLLVFFMILLSSVTFAAYNAWDYQCGCPTVGASTKDAQNAVTSWGCAIDSGGERIRYYCGTRGSFGISCPYTYATAYFTCPTTTCPTTDVCEGNEWVDYPIYDSATPASCQQTCIGTPTGTSSTKADAGDTACQNCALDCTARRSKVIGKCNVQCLSNSDCTDPSKPVCNTNTYTCTVVDIPVGRTGTMYLSSGDSSYLNLYGDDFWFAGYYDRSLNRIRVSSNINTQQQPQAPRYSGVVSYYGQKPLSEISFSDCIGAFESITNPATAVYSTFRDTLAYCWKRPDGYGRLEIKFPTTQYQGTVRFEAFDCPAGKVFDSNTNSCKDLPQVPPVISNPSPSGTVTTSEGPLAFLTQGCDYKGFACDPDNFGQSLDLFAFDTAKLGEPPVTVTTIANRDNSNINVATICGSNSAHEFQLDSSSLPPITNPYGLRDMRVYVKNIPDNVYMLLGGSTCPSVSEPYPNSVDKLYYLPISVQTNVASICKFSTADSTYSSMNYYVMKSDDNLDHKLGFSEYQSGTNNIYVRCKGIANGLENTQSTLIQFDIDPTLAKCTNRNKDTDETDYNCGNVCVSLGKTCEIGKSCNVNSDCTSNICNAQKKCEAPPVCTINKIGWGVYRAGNLIGEAYYNVVDGNYDKANLIDPNNMDSDDNGAIEVLYTDELEAILETSACTDTQKSAFAPEIYESDFATDTKRETLTRLSISTTNSNQLRKRWTGLQNVPDLERKEQFYLRVNPESPPIETEDPSIICGNTVIDTNYGEECDDSATPVYSGDNDGTCKKFNSFYKLGSLACGEPGTSDACLIDESQCVFDDEQLEALFDDPGEEACLASVQAGNKATFTVGECIDGSKTVNCQVPSGCEGIQEALDVFCRGEETRQVICLTQLEEPFPVFTGFNILIVTLLLGGYYLIRRKN